MSNDLKIRPRPKLVIFDLDGTLIDSAADLALGVNAILADFGRSPLPARDLRAMIGEGARMLVTRALAASPGDAIDLDVALGRFLALYGARPVVETVLYPGVARTLDILRQNAVPLALCTNKPEVISRDILAAFGIDRYFDPVIGGDSYPWRKPDPRVLAPHLASRGLLETECLLVGDSETDAATAAALGMDFALFTGGYRRGPAESIPATYRLDRMDELLAAIGVAD